MARLPQQSRRPGEIGGNSMSHTALLLALILGIVATVQAAVYFSLKRFNLVQQNYRGVKIPFMYGFAITIPAIALLANITLPRDSISTTNNPQLWIFAIISFTILGVADDIAGDRTVKGLKGHLLALTMSHKITTGLVKAVVGLAVGLFCGKAIGLDTVMKVSGGLTISLCANAFNLLDLRPGRASGTFVLTSVILSAVALQQHQNAALLLICVLLPTALEWIVDSRALAMMGDTGSNVIGASMGLAIVSFQSTAINVLSVIGLIGLHILAERVSLTKVITSCAPLNWLDHQTGVRD